MIDSNYSTFVIANVCKGSGYADLLDQLGYIQCDSRSAARAEKVYLVTGTKIEDKEGKSLIPSLQMLPFSACE